MATRAEIRTVIQAAGFGADTASVLAQDVAISTVMSELSGERQWSWLQKVATGALTAGSEAVAIPTDHAVPRAVHLLEPGSTSALPVLTQVDEHTLRERLLADTPVVRAAPTMWSWYDQTILVYPRPDKAYVTKLSYIKFPAIDLDGTYSGTEAQIFEPRFHMLIAWGAIRWLAVRQRDFALVNVAAAEYARARQQLEQADRPSTPDHVVDWPGWRGVRGY